MAQGQGRAARGDRDPGSGGRTNRISPPSADSSRCRLSTNILIGFSHPKARYFDSGLSSLSLSCFARKTRACPPWQARSPGRASTGRSPFSGSPLVLALRVAYGGPNLISSDLSSLAQRHSPGANGRTLMRPVGAAPGTVRLKGTERKGTPDSAPADFAGSLARHSSQTVRARGILPPGPDARDPSRAPSGVFFAFVSRSA
ncbi:MAG: hypothetical protein BMS9Abin10_0763 [Gammaproteobacteria bacterium]|nr:MAG: hypothetical protein BMS9Abin10_0763 [Gammaproteobacteria bacterium]